MKRKRVGRSRNGFTLIEMTVVLFIISLLVLIIIPNISSARNHANTVHKHAMVSVVQTQIDDYLDNHSKSAVSYDDLVQDGDLTTTQRNKAEAEGINIHNNKADFNNNK